MQVLTVKAIQISQIVNLRAEFVRKDQRRNDFYCGQTVGGQTEGHGGIVVAPIVFVDRDGLKSTGIAFVYIIPLDRRSV